MALSCSGLARRMAVVRRQSHSVISCVTTSACVLLIGMAVLSRPATATESSQNAALQYWLAFELSPDVRKKSIWNASSDDPLYGFRVPVSPGRARFFQVEGALALRHLHRGAQMPDCEWGVDLRKDGMTVASRHGEKARGLAALAMLRARWYFEQEQWNKGIDDIIATMVMGRHIGRDMVHYNINYGCMVENLCVTTAAIYLPRMPEAARRTLSTKLDLLPQFTPMRDIIRNWEKTIVWAIEAFPQAESEGRLNELLTRILGAKETEALLHHAGDAAGLVTLSEQSRPILRECAEFAKESPQEYERLFKERIQPKLDENPVASIFVSSFDTARGEESTAHCRLAFLKTALDIMSRGDSALVDHPDPYGTGPFGYREFDGGFELCSALFYYSSICLDVGMRK